MPTDPKTFQESRLPWSRWKHKILINYLKAMAAILRNYETIYYIDGFAGPGRYLDDKEDGSPLLAAKHANGLKYPDGTYTLRCINVEADYAVFQNLQDATSNFEPFVENYHGDFSDFVNVILERITDKPALFFLDPIGLKGLEWQSLLPILNREATTELLLRFDAQTALRLTGEGENLHATFNSILGVDNSDFWKSYIDSSSSNTQSRRESLARCYEDQLSAHFRYVARMSIRSSDDKFKYFLLFATRSLKGVQAMNDVFYSVSDLRDRTLDEERITQGTPKQMGMFTQSEEEKILHELEALKSIALDVMTRGQDYRRDDLRAEVALSRGSFGRFSRSQFTALLGGKPRGIKVPKEFNSLKERIQIHNRKTVGDDKVLISLSI